jgi:hypothetical protein
MSTLLKKDQLPLVAYFPVYINGEIVMYNPQVSRDNEGGLAAYYPESNEIKFITYKEIVENLMTAECEPAKEEKKSGKPRPVSPTVTADRERKSQG